jgi:predicted ferric reductase
MLLLLQLPLAGRLKLLDRLFALPGLVRQHRYHAWTIALMALLHPVCVSIPEDRLLIPLEMRYWPEWIGVALLSLIALQFVASQWRKRLKIAFHTWMRFHRVAGVLAAALVIIHVLYVSETFETEGLPRSGCADRRWCILAGVAVDSNGLVVAEPAPIRLPASNGWESIAPALN